MFSFVGQIHVTSWSVAYISYHSKDQYMTSANQYVHQSDLASRVREWEDRIKPILDVEVPFYGYV